jgi:hypothetical protein
MFGVTMSVTTGNQSPEEATMPGSKKATTKKATTTRKAPAAAHVPCPHCGAKADEHCVSPDGTRWTGGHSHKARVAAGEAKPPKAAPKKKAAASKAKKAKAKRTRKAPEAPATE